MPGGETDARSLRHRGLLIESVRAAGALALQAFRTQQRSWMKDGNSPVSESDMAVDALLHDRLMTATPDFGWLSEESADDRTRLARDHVWVVDPIDGTRAYLGGRPDWTISAALVSNGRPVLAALYAPASDEFFVAAVGEGAWLNNARIATRRGPVSGQAQAAGPQSYLRKLTAARPGTVTVPKIHSLALRLTRVAQGALDVAFASGNSRDWDLAAADLLVHEAGGTLTSFSGRPVVYNRPVPVHEALIAAGRDRHAALLDLVRERSSCDR